MIKNQAKKYCSSEGVPTRTSGKLKLWLLAGLFMLLVVATSTAVGDMAVAHNVQPALLAAAAAQPEATVRVIVHKGEEVENMETAVAALNGIVLKDLHIINALVVELPARSVVDLAQTQGVRWVNLDGPMESVGRPPRNPQPPPSNYFLDTLNVRQVWDMGLDGSGVTVAVIDSGVHRDKDLQINPSSGRPASRVREQLTFNSRPNQSGDVMGHGTHVAGIIGGSGYDSNGIYAGIAPGVHIISLKVSNDTGMAYESDTVDAMQWVLENKDTYNIRIVNMSINSSLEQSYHASPLNAAAEILWFNGIVVVTSAGNEMITFNTVRAAPANDPFVITVGASDENGDALRAQDVIADYSAQGITLDGHLKPDVIAPGQDIVSIAGTGVWWNDHPNHRVEEDYFRASGTSMAAPMVSGAIALLLQDEPGLNPDQVKYRLMNTGSTIYGTGIGANTGYAYLDVYDLVTSDTVATANTGTPASALLWTGSEPVTWGSANWASVNWASVNWASVNWASVNWASVNWASVNWDED